MKYFFICLTISLFFLTPILNVHAVSSNRYYAGYNYYGYSSSPRWGVKGNVMTIWAEIPWNEMCAEWTCVILDYSPLYWIQCGYYQYWLGIFPAWNFYIEKQDSNGHWMLPLQLLHPLVGHTYTYAIWYDTTQAQWRYAILEGSTWLYSGWRPVDPDQPCDLQGFVETSHKGVHIGGSHFSKLTYWDPGISWWPYWNRHDPYTSPHTSYSLDERGHYEFYASGGG